jgi:hypothetical protein
VFARLVQGLVAGAAGTTALNAVTYSDMAVRARPASDTPQHAMEILAEKAGHPVSGSAETKQNRLAGLGPLAGIATGLNIGILAAFLRPVLDRLPAPMAAAAIGATAMALTDRPLVKLGLTDPKDWSGADWLSDIVPHLAYGTATYATLEWTRRR